MHNQTTGAASGSTGGTFTLEDLKKLERDLANMKPLKWTLVSPDGRVWQDDNPKALFMVLARHVYNDDLTNKTPAF